MCCLSGSILYIENSEKIVALTAVDPYLGLIDIYKMSWSELLKVEK